jgi:hypothetical protein
VRQVASKVGALAAVLVKDWKYVIACIQIIVTKKGNSSAVA